MAPQQLHHLLRQHVHQLLAGNLALGVHMGAVKGAKAARYMEVARGITRTCYEMYNRTATGTSAALTCDFYISIIDSDSFARIAGFRAYHTFADQCTRPKRGAKPRPQLCSLDGVAVRKASTALRVQRWVHEAGLLAIWQRLEGARCSPALHMPSRLQ